MSQELVPIDPEPEVILEAVELASAMSEAGSPELPPKWELQSLKTKHKQIASLVTQGMKQKEVAQICRVTKEYVSMLMRQPLVQEYIAQLVAVSDQRLEAMTVKSVDVIGEILENGSEKGRLQAARMQLEATKRIGRPDPTRGQTAPDEDRFVKLAERLLALNAPRTPGTFNQSGQEITDVL